MLFIIADKALGIAVRDMSQANLSTLMLYFRECNWKSRYQPFYLQPICLM